MLSKAGKKVRLTLSAGKLWDRAGPGAQWQKESSLGKEAKAEVYIVIVFELPRAGVRLGYQMPEWE